MPTIKISEMNGGLTPSGSELIEMVQFGDSVSLPISGIGTYLLKNNISNQDEIINGNFNVWQRDTSQTAVGYGSDDRWYNYFGSMTYPVTFSQQSFTLGQTDVPNSSDYYSRTNFTTNNTSSEFVFKAQKIEDVTKLAGKTWTLSFFAKADASKNIAIEGRQFFGTTGSPSTTVDAISVTTIPLIDTWTYNTATLTFPSVSGATLGDDDNDCTWIVFWYQAGSDYNSRTNSLGNQSGTFDLSRVKLEEGNVATPYVPRHISEELLRCYRYYIKINHGTSNSCSYFGYALSTTLFRSYLALPCQMRAAGTISGVGAYISPGGNASSSSPNITRTNPNGIEVNDTTTGLVAGGVYIVKPDVNAVLEIDAEL